MIIGIDEVGRGCWAGPLVVGAAILGEETDFHDSKVRSRRQRELDLVRLERSALSLTTGWVTPVEVDELGLTAATKLAVQRALADVTLSPTRILIDGNVNYLPGDDRVELIIDGDATVPAIAAASILAKVLRDRYMVLAHDMWEDYGFDRHVGYGTAQHRASLARHGLCPLHRRSFKPVQAFL